MNSNSNEPDNRWPPPAVLLPPMAWPMPRQVQVAPIPEPPVEPPIVIDLRVEPSRGTIGLENKGSWLRTGAWHGSTWGIALVVCFSILGIGSWIVNRLSQPAPLVSPIDDRANAIWNTNQAIKNYTVGGISADAKLKFNWPKQMAMVEGYARNKFGEITLVQVYFRVTKWNSEEHWELFGVCVGGDWKYISERGHELKLTWE